LTPSVFTKEKIKQFSKTGTEINVVHNGVDFERFQKDLDYSDLYKKYGDKKNLLTVGGLKPRKGQDVVLNSLAKIKDAGYDFHYFIIGDGRWRKYLEQLAKNLKLEKEVSFMGSLDGDDLVRYFQFCDIYIHTPRNVNWNFEGFGIVYLEASACGKPIIAADSGGIKDAVINNKTGLIVKEESVEETAKAVISLFENPTKAKSLGEGGKRYASDHKWLDVTKKIVDNYKNILKV
jgi:phosphatidylinositol alpha-1,6-mannosyltransferase